MSAGYNIVSNGTDTHLMLLDLRSTGKSLLFLLYYRYMQLFIDYSLDFFYQYDIYHDIRLWSICLFIKGTCNTFYPQLVYL